MNPREPANLKRRGGQPGNQNARKTGLYSRHLPTKQAEAYRDIVKEQGIDGEIALVRLCIRNLLATEAPHDQLMTAIAVLIRLVTTQYRFQEAVTSLQRKE